MNLIHKPISCQSRDTCNFKVRTTILLERCPESRVVIKLVSGTQSYRKLPSKPSG